MKTCYIYARTATIAQQEVINGHNNKINEQVRACQDYAKKHSYEILGVFTDIGSEDTLKRAGLQRLLIYCKKHPSTAVIILRVGRISRNLADYSKLHLQLKEKDIQLISVIEGDLSGSTGNLLGGILVAKAQFESERSKYK